MIFMYNIEGDFYENLYLCEVFMTKRNISQNEKASQPLIIYRPQIDSSLFRKFSLYHTFAIRKLWKRPLLFSLIFLIFSMICFIGKGNTHDGILLGTVLLSVGIGLPLIYFASFYYSVHKQNQKMGLSVPKAPYFLEFFEDHVLIRYAKNGKNGKSLPNETFLWENIHKVIYRKNVFYLYITPDKAFLLPYGQANRSDEYVRDFFLRVLNPQQIKD